MKYTQILMSIALSILIATPILAQQAREDVVYLRDGSIIRGIIIRQIENESLTIRTKDGSQFVYPMNDVFQITKEPLTGSSYAAMKNRPFALGLSCVLPGLGQFYNEQTGKGAVMLGGSIVGLTLMGVGFVESSDPDNVDPEAGNGPFYTGLILCVSSLIWSMVDAYSTAGRINEQNPSRVALNLRPAAGPNAISARFTFRF